MEHLKYCVREILAAKELLSIPNSSFFARGIARMIAVRNDDFIKSSFRVNKANGRSKSIRNDINALDDLYKNHLALQRNKFGAHFQPLDLSTRFDSWQNINYESSSFFTDMPVMIYDLFNMVPNFDAASSLIVPLPLNIRESIKNHNEAQDIEKYPTIGVDSLALTRHNTGGMLVGSTTQEKAATLKSIEILIDYNIGLLNLVEGTDAYEILVKKMLLIDIISYADNLISRIDLLPGAPQEEKGLNTLAGEQNFKAASEVMTEFLASYKFHENLTRFRLIRNKSCGHIDISVPTSDLDIQIAALDINTLLNFYNLIKGVFKEVCSRDFLLRMFCIEPGERIHDAVSMTGLSGLTSYDGSVYETVLPVVTDINDEKEYKLNFERFHESRDENSRQFFYSCFANSDFVEESKVTYGNESYSKYSHVQIRKAHVFFKNLLLDSNLTEDKKFCILNLFSASAHGYPDTLLRILLDTYNNNSSTHRLQYAYIDTIGDLCQDECIEVYDILRHCLKFNDLDFRYHTLLAFFKIDIFSLRNRPGGTISSSVSETIIAAIQKINRPKFKCLIAVGLLSNLFFNRKISHSEKKVRACYVAPLENIVRDFIRIELLRLPKTDANRRKVRKITTSFVCRAYSTCFALLGEFYDKNKDAEAALFFRNAIHNQYVRFNQENFTELHNYACICYKLLDFEKAVSVAEFIVQRNPWDIERRRALLGFYQSEQRFLARFEREKKYLLENFVLSTKTQNMVQNMVHAPQNAEL